MRHIGVTALVLIAVLLGTSLVAAAGGAATQSGSSRPSLDAVVAAGSPGALVLLDQGGSRREDASGLAVLRGGVPLHTGDRFRAGSITKTFVAVVVLQLVAEEQLGLGDTVERWLPGLVPNGGRITVRQLLAHTSGLADYAGDAAFLRRTVSEPRRRWKPRELVRVALAQRSVARPGERFAYASTNYVLLGLVVERATGTTLERRAASPDLHAARASRHELLVGHADPGSSRTRLRAEPARRHRRQPRYRSRPQHGERIVGVGRGRDRLDGTGPVALLRSAPARPIAPRPPARADASARWGTLRARARRVPNAVRHRNRPHRQPARHRLRRLEQPRRPPARRRDDQQLPAVAGSRHRVPSAPGDSVLWHLAQAAPRGVCCDR